MQPNGSQTFDFLEGLRAVPEISHVIFDFDGTLSWLRHGWPRMMAEIMRSYYPKQASETEESIHRMLISDILSLNGKPTIYQMIRFEERVHERGGTCPTPEQLRQEYQDRLDGVINERSHLVLEGLRQPDEFVVHGARALLDQLQERGLRLIILSGTIEHRVREEAELLRLTPYFGRHIYGGTADHTQFSKRKVIDRLMLEEGIKGNQLLSFGDGPVEIEETKRVGGMAIAVASNEEENGTGVMDLWKREQLLQAGADGVIADFRSPENLIAAILGSSAKS